MQKNNKIIIEHTLLKHLNNKLKIMDTVHITDCRICGNGSGQYNIFSDELCFDMKSSKKTKIFKCLNDFLFEKVTS